MASMRKEVLRLYKQMLFMGREWPQGYTVFRDRTKKVFLKNSVETDPAKIRKSLDLGNYVLKEIEALYKLKKYRTLKKRNEDVDTKKEQKVDLRDYLQGGVLVAKKDFNAPKHDEIESVPNLQVIKAMQSLKSRGYVKEQFSWQHYYWYLTNEGIQYLREYLHLPQEIVPATLKRPARTETARARPKGYGEGDRAMREDREERDAYRRGPGDFDKKAETGPGASFDPTFRGGYQSDSRAAPFGRGGGRGPPAGGF